MQNPKAPGSTTVHVCWTEPKKQNPVTNPLSRVLPISWKILRPPAVWEAVRLSRASAGCSAWDSESPAGLSVSDGGENSWSERGASRPLGWLIHWLIAYNIEGHHYWAARQWESAQWWHRLFIQSELRGRGREGGRQEERQVYRGHLLQRVSHYSVISAADGGWVSFQPNWTPGRGHWSFCSDKTDHTLLFTTSPRTYSGRENNKVLQLCIFQLRTTICLSGRSRSVVSLSPGFTAKQTTRTWQNVYLKDKKKKKPLSFFTEKLDSKIN